MPTNLIIYQVILVLAGLPVGLCVGWFYQKAQLKVQKGETSKASFFASCVMPYLFFVPMLWMLGEVAYAFAGFMVLSVLTSFYTARHASEASH